MGEKKKKVLGSSVFDAAHSEEIDSDAGTAPARAPMKITVKTMNGDKFELKVAPSETIKSVKLKIKRKMKGAEPDFQRLMFNGRRLEDERALSDYDIKEDSTIELILNIPGGGAAPQDVPGVEHPEGHDDLPEEEEEEEKETPLWAKVINPFGIFRN